MRFLIFLTVLYTVALVVMSAPTPSEELIGGGVPHPKTREGEILSQGGQRMADKPIWEGGNNVKPWLTNNQHHQMEKPITITPSKSANK